MEQVEEICESIVLINKGKIILNGNVKDIRHQFKKNEFSIHYNGLEPNLSADRFPVLRKTDHELIVKIEDRFSSTDLMRELVNDNVEISSFTELLPSLNEIFIQQVEEKNNE